MEVSEALRKFIGDRISTPTQVPVMLWLWSHPEQRITPSLVAASVGMSETQCSDALDELVKSGLAACVDPARRLFAYRELGETLEKMLSELATAYAESRNEVLSLIADGAMSRIRSAAVRSFVDCQNIVFSANTPPERSRS